MSKSQSETEPVSRVLPPPAHESASEVVAKSLRAMTAFLEAGLLERDTAARLMLLAAVAGEHVLLLGPPGTAKSELARRLQHVMEPLAGTVQPDCFERLLTRFSTPEELFGPLSLKALEDDRYERLVEGYLPTAQVAFLDEVFKANSAILNALLTLLNERVFDNGTERRPVPLVTLVGASNETPSDEALQAFYDRFLLRIPVEPVSDAAFDELLMPASAPSAPPEERLSEAARSAIAQQAQAVTLSASTQTALRDLRTRLRDEHGTPRVSDRRWRQLAHLLRVAAAAEGRSAVEPPDLWLAAYVTSSEPKAVQSILTWWQQSVMGIQSPETPGWRRGTEAFEKQLEIETRAQAEEGADEAGKMALARSIGGAQGSGASGEMLRLVSARAEEHLRKRWSPLHVRARTAQVQALRESVLTTLEQAQATWVLAEAPLANRLWLPPSLAQSTLAPLRERIAQLSELAQRLQAAETGFAALPVDERLTEVPLPIPVSA